MTEERILDFLDGNLGASEEEELLHRLAVSPERRSLLKQHLQMRELTASLARKSYVNVPKVVTASLFTTLAANGYAGPSMPAAAESVEAIKIAASRSVDRVAENIIATRATGVFTRSAIIFASVASFLIGAAAIYMAMPGAHQEKPASVSNLFQNQSPVIQPLKAEMISPPSSSVLAYQDNISQNKTEHNVNSNSKNITYRNAGTLKNSSVDNTVNSDIPNNNIGIIPDAEGNSNALASISSTESKYPTAIPVSADIHGAGLTAKNPFDGFKLDPVSERSFLQRLTLSFRAGEGKAPGNEQALTGSLVELKVAYDISDIFDVKISGGYFMPYEKQAIAANPGFNSDGFRLLQLSPVMQYRAIVGAELGLKFSMFDAPFELSGGFISDMATFVPRLGFFTSLSLQDNLSMNIGLEGMIYNHDIRSSLRSAQAAYAGEHPSLIGQLQEKETTGFIGPSIEMVYHF